MNSNELAMYEKSTYEYAFKNVARKIDRQALDAFKEGMGGITLKEAMTSDELSLFIPQIFTDEIVPLGLRVATARNNFPAISQTVGVDFKVRFRQKTEGAQVLREQGWRVPSSQSRSGVAQADRVTPERRGRGDNRA